MAIKFNKRKRKHDEIETHENGKENVDESELVIPKKMSKKSEEVETPKKEKKKKKKEKQNAEEEEVDKDDVPETAADGNDETLQQVDADATTENNEIVENETNNKQKKKSKQKQKQEGGDNMDDNDDDAAAEDAECSPDSGIEPEPQLKFSKDFKMLHFRTKLRGTNFITELRHFLHMQQTTRPKIIAKYIEKRGKPLEIAEALERIDKTNILHVAYLCDALQLVVMEIITNQKQLMESAVYACRYFLKTHNAVIDQLLKSAPAKHRCIALKLLTAIVCVDPQLGRQLLSSYDILSNVQKIMHLLTNFREKQQSADNTQNVRKCYIHFVLAFLIDGNTLLIRNIVDRVHLIRALIKGLYHDDHVTICMVLNTLRSFVLECAEISKTKKLHVFDVECCKDLTRLYNWCGQDNKKQIQRTVSDKEAKKMAGEEAYEAVANAVHEFLLVLFTSRKHGVAFDATTHYRAKHNTLQSKIIGTLRMPYLSERKEELIIKTLQACPELARHTVRNYAGIVKVDNAKNKALRFLAHIIAAVTPNLLANAMDKMTLTDLQYWIREACAPLEALTLITGFKYLTHLQYSTRLATNQLLFAMMRQYSNYMSAIAKREEAKRAPNSLRRFKFELLNHLLVNFPSITNILKSLHLSILAQTEAKVNVLEHLNITLDLVLVMCKENSAFIHKTSQIIDFLDLLRPLYETKFDDMALEPSSTAPEQTLQFAKKSSLNIRLELKAIKTILLLFPRALQPQQPLFQDVVKSFIKAFVHADAVVRHEAGSLLYNLFKNTGIFDACSYEIDFWLEALRCLDAETVEDVADILIKTFQHKDASVELPALTDSETVYNNQNLERLFEHIEKGLSVQAYVETLSISKFLPLIFKGVEMAAPYDKYIEIVCMLLFHYYPTPTYVLKVYSTELSSQIDYMQSWLPAAEKKNKHKQINLHETGNGECIPLLQTLQKALIEGNVKFEQAFAKANTQDYFELELQGQMLQLHGELRNERLLMIYVQQVLFQVAQAVELQQLTAKQAELAADYLIKFLEISQIHEEKTKDSEAAAAEAADEEAESLLNRMLHYIYGIRLNYVRATELFSAVDETQLHYLHFLRLLTDYCKNLTDFEKHAAIYRLKIIKSVAISLEDVPQTKAASNELLECVKLVESFNLTAENCVELLSLLTEKLVASDYFELSKPTVYYELLLNLLRRLTSLQEPLAQQYTELIKTLAKYYIKFNKQCAAGQELPLESYEAVLYDFLVVYHQHIGQFGEKFFECCCNAKKLNKTTIKLATLLLERNAGALEQTFLKILAENMEKKELIYPLLNVAFKLKLHIETQVLQTCYQAFKNGFMKSIEKPQKAAVIYKDNAACSVALVQNCMPKSECIDFCKKQLKIDGVELYQMRLIQAIYKVAINECNAKESGANQAAVIFVNFINLMLQLLSIELKKPQICHEKLEYFAWYMYDWWQSAAAEAVEHADFSKLLSAQQWLNYCKSSLKLGMYQNENAETEAAETIDRTNGLLLQLLGFLCNKLYVNYNEVEPSDNQTAAQLFEMICTHSRCFDILLTPRIQPTQVKTALLQLLHTLACKAPQALQAEQIPIVLGAYQARLTAADRYALALLELYEHYDIGLQHYRPFIWGESAIAFYSLRASDDERAKLQQQDTSIMQVMSLIDKQVCLYTIDNFPIWRSLHAGAQLPDLQFANPALKSLTFGANTLEQRIELGETQFSANELRICPKREAIYAQCYDPAFFVPLLSHCFAPETLTHPARPIQNGLLSLAFVALASQDKDMRLAAACCQQRYRTQFEQSKFYEKPLWQQTYENIQSGLSDLRTAWMQHKRNSGTPRVPLIPALFIAKTFNLTTDPTHLLYKQLTMYLRLKSSFNFQTIPEFNVLFYSPEVEHHEYRQFIIEIIRDGIKCSADLFLLVTTNTFKVLMGFYGTDMSTLNSNLLILSIFSTCVKIPGSAKIMIETVGVLPWLAAVIADTQFYHFDIIEGLLSICNNLWYALKACEKDFHNFSYLQMAMQRLLLQLQPLLSPRISVSNIAKYLNILQKTATGLHFAMRAEQLDALLDCVTKHFPKHMASVQCIRKYGGAGAETHEDFCQNLYEKLQHDEVVDAAAALLALSSLRAYVIEWWQVTEAQAEAHSVNNIAEIKAV